jgi:hypothetical protein
MATEAARLKRKKPQEGRGKPDLTLTGLLMEGWRQRRPGSNARNLRKEEENQT